MEVRDLWPQTLIDIGGFRDSSPIVKILRFLEKFLYRKANKIITLLPLAKNYIGSLGINQGKIVWIPNGVDLGFYDKIKPSSNIERCFKVIYAGGLTKGDALDIILNAAKIIQDRKYLEIKFIFIGNGLEKKNLIKYKNKLKLENVEFRESVIKKSVPTILAEADILIISQRRISLYKYGFSYNKLFDFMAAAKPIIFAGNSSNDPVVEGGCGISILPENPEKMAEAIIKLYKMAPEEREKIGKKGREYVEKYHSIPVLVDKLEEVIKEIVNE